VTDLDTLGEVVAGARCWGIELDPRYRVLAVTVEPDPLRVTGTGGEHQLLCFPVSVLLVSVTRHLVHDGGGRMALMTFELDQLTAVSERFGGATIDAPPFGRPEPRPGTWGPRYSLEGRTSAADGTRATLSLDLATEDGARLRLFARFDEAELRDAARTVVMGAADLPPDLTRLLGTPGPIDLDPSRPAEERGGRHGRDGTEVADDPLRFRPDPDRRS